jgi:hypothetical protein
MGQKESAEETIKSIRRHTRRQYSAEEKIRIVIAAIAISSIAYQVFFSE